MNVICEFCTRGELRSLWQVDAWRYLACPVCRHARLDPLPQRPEAERLYGAEYFDAGANTGYVDYLADERLHRLNARDRLGRIRLRRSAPGTLLDFGCAAGFFLDEARQAGWEVRGVDCSPWAREAAARFGLQVAPDWPADGARFDVVSLFQVLEHLPQPREALAAARERLTPDGTLILETWDRGSLIARLCGKRWQQVSPPSVIHLFSRESLRRAVEAAGFCDVQIRATGKCVSAEFVGGLLARKYPRLFGPLGRLLSHSALGRISAKYALGDLITLTARKSAWRASSPSLLPRRALG